MIYDCTVDQYSIYSYCIKLHELVDNSVIYSVYVQYIIIISIITIINTSIYVWCTHIPMICNHTANTV